MSWGRWPFRRVCHPIQAGGTTGPETSRQRNPWRSEQHQIAVEIPGKLVVRTYAPARRWVISAILLLLGGLALYVAFELGRYKAGYDAMQAASERDALQVQIAQQ